MYRCDEHLVVALETLCHRWNMREDVAGATFLAFGSAAPEIVINAVTTIKSASSAASGQPSTALGISAIIGFGGYLCIGHLYMNSLYIDASRRRRSASPPSSGSVVIYI